MNKNYFILSIIPILLAIGGQAPEQTLRQRLRSSDAQVRCDAFYELFAGGEHERHAPIELYGKTTKEIQDLLGEPTSTSILEYKETSWLQVQFLFEVCPTKKPCKKGWRYGPSLLFRNGLSVSWQIFSDETGADRYSVTPEHLRFKTGGIFP